MPRLYVSYTTPLNLTTPKYEENDYLIVLGAPEGSVPSLSILQSKITQSDEGPLYRQRYAALIGTIRTNNNCIINEEIHDALLKARNTGDPLAFNNTIITTLLNSTSSPSPTKAFLIETLPGYEAEAPPQQVPPRFTDELARTNRQALDEARQAPDASTMKTSVG